MSAERSSDAAPQHDIVALIALCPLLAVSDTIANALNAGVAMLVVTIASATISVLLPRWLQDELRLAALALIITSLVTMIALLANAWMPFVHDSLGVFLILIASNVLLLAHMQSTLQSPVQTIATSIKAAGAMLIAMLTLGVARELVGRGSLLREAGNMFGTWAGDLYLQLFREDMGFLLAVLPPGAFISIGLLFALAKWWRGRRA